MSDAKPLARVYIQTNVWDKTLERIEWIYANFDHVIVSFSGGKDSTVCLELAIMVAKKLGRLPVNVMFLDQEAEYEAVIDYVSSVMERDFVRPFWYQIPFKLFNAMSPNETWLNCWDENKKELWMRKKVNYSIQSNTYGVDRYGKLMSEIQIQDFPVGKVAKIGGVRCEESPARYLALTQKNVHKGVTWGAKTRAKNNVIFYPLYDWSYTDIWKAIHVNKWDYCSIYNLQYQHGVPLTKMRVSSLCHEISNYNLTVLQEQEPKTWEKLTARLSGIDTEGKFSKDFQIPKELPYMFVDWKDYRQNLLEKLIGEEDQLKFERQFNTLDKKYSDDGYLKICCSAILKNDYHSTTLHNYDINQYSVEKKEI